MASTPTPSPVRPYRTAAALPLDKATADAIREVAEWLGEDPIALAKEVGLARYVFDVYCAPNPYGRRI